jgi:glycosyltransferase involved in cell wall biosynthesis
MKSNRQGSPVRLRLVFVASNGAWGGSEELWGAAAAVLARRGHRVIVYKRVVPVEQPRLKELRSLGCKIRELARLPLLHLLHSKIHSALSVLAAPIRLWLTMACARRPDLVIVSQGCNADGRRLADVCLRLGMNYVLISQKATEMYWPVDRDRENLRQIYRSARWCFFVSEHNRRLTEEQLAIALPHASVVRNPFLVRTDLQDHWPEECGAWRLACVGRLQPSEKGQDLVLRVLAREKWRARPLSVTFFGSGDWRCALEEMARYLRLESVSFGGFAADVDAIWDVHHGLLLPSRCEGMALVMIEAMLRARVAILTDVAGAREIVEDDITGFLAAAPTEDSLDEALERAWQRRAEWRAIGAGAAQRVRELVPPDPATVFADTLEQIAMQGAGSTAFAPVAYPRAAE